MQIEFTKNSHKPCIFKITRADGSQTWSKFEHLFHAHHDLMHYALETTLGYTQAFYGIINSGYDIQDFELPKNERPKELLSKNLPQEALWAEILIGLLQAEHFQKMPKEDFFDTLAFSCKEKGWEFPAHITANEINTIRNRFEDLWLQWQNLEDGKTLNLEWE